MIVRPRLFIILRKKRSDNAVDIGGPTETTVKAGDWFAGRGSNHTQHLLRDVQGNTGPEGGMFCV